MLDKIQIRKLNKGDEYDLFDINNKFIIGKVKLGGYLYAKEDYKYHTEGEKGKRIFKIIRKYSFRERFKIENKFNNNRSLMLAIFDFKYMINIWKSQFITVLVV